MSNAQRLSKRRRGYVGVGFQGAFSNSIPKARRFYFNQSYKTRPAYKRGTNPRARQYGFKASHLSLRTRSFMPNQLTTTLRFAGSFAETAAAGHIDMVLRGNSPYDPYSAAGGEEAAGWDELAAIYKNYRVLSSGVRLTTCNLDADDPVHVSIFADTVSTAEDGSAAAYSQPGSQTGTATLNGGTSVVTNWCSTKLMLGPLYSDSDTCASTAANPAKEWFWHCIWDNVSGNALNLNYRLEMTYRVQFFDLVFASQT